VRWSVAALCAVLGSSAASAQVIPPLPGRGRTATPTRDTTAKSALDSVAKLATPDSVMQRLLTQPGFTSTRYQGQQVTFREKEKDLELLPAPKEVAIVKRGTQTIVSDSGIFYREATRRVVTGGHYILSDPSSGQADVVGTGPVDYNLAERRGLIHNAKFPVNNGETWYMTVKTAALVTDSLQPGGHSEYIRGGTLTSCPDSIPDYHFEYGDAKHIGNTIVAAPAVLYIRDIPVIWLPFIFADSKTGRRSGILPPRFGVGDIVRNSPSYRRNVDNVGYYWALSEYMDLSAWLDWRSGAGTNTTGFPDPGWSKWNAEWQYKWTDRMLAGRLASSYTFQGDASRNFAVSWGHQQEFSKDSRISTNLNYVTNTTLQRQNNFNPYTVLATISSQVNYQRKIGPASLTVGGTMRQYPGREQVDRNLPTVSITTGPLDLAKWLVWTPSFNFSASQTLHMDQPGPTSFRVITNELGRIDSVRTDRSAYTAQASFDTPLRIFGFEIRNSFRINQMRNDFPEQKTIYDVVTGAQDTRIFSATYRTDIEWNPDFQIPLPRNIGGPFNIVPGVSFQNVDAGPFFVRTERTNGKFVHQTKRATFGLSAAPTIYGLIPGFGPFFKLRHAISPTISYGYAPAARVSDEYLAAIGNTRVGYLGSLAQNAVTFGLNQNIEAKIRSKTDTNPETARPVKLLSLNFASLSYDFERLKELRKKGRGAVYGLTTSNWGYTLSSDLLPGFQLSSNYSLFEGNTVSDSAIFKPYHENISASLNISQTENPFVILARLFGKAVPEAQTTAAPPADLRQPPDAVAERRIAGQPVAGQGSRGERYLIPVNQGWRASFSLSSSRPRPPTGDKVIDFDPRQRCEQIAAGNPFLLQACLDQIRAQPTTDTPIGSTTAGGQAYRIPATTSLNSSINFNLTPMWAMGWQTTYDVERGEFASHIVQLQREIHDWRAIFAFTQSPNGNFAFNFSIGLKAEPDLKFDYNRATVRGTQPF